MKKWVSTIEKRNFLQWFLDNFRLKRTDTRKLFELFMKNNHILEHLSFTEKISLTEKTIVISSLNSDEPGFEYYYNHRKTSDVATAIGDIQANPSGKVNMILNFHGKMMNQRYIQLIGPQVSENIKTYQRYEKISMEVDSIITTVMLENEKEKIRKQIDLALDQRNEELFKELVLKLNSLKLNECGKE